MTNVVYKRSSPLNYLYLVSLNRLRNDLLLDDIWDLMITSFVLAVDCCYLWCTCSSHPYIELIIFKRWNVLDAEITLFSSFCSGLLSSDYVEIHYENGKPQYSKVWKSCSINILNLRTVQCTPRCFDVYPNKPFVFLYKGTIFKFKIYLGEIY